MGSDVARRLVQINTRETTVPVTFHLLYTPMSATTRPRIQHFALDKSGCLPSFLAEKK